MDVALAVLKITALLFAVIAFAFTVNYCAKPEDFSIKRLRLSRARRLSHSELIIRAYIGAGLVSSAFFALPYVILGLYDVTGWFKVTSIGGLMIGTGTYCYFRLSRYRKLTSSELQSGNDAKPGTFCLRER